jgi:formyl-CoA transferase
MRPLPEEFDTMAALDGMRVLDMTQYEAGTSCTQLLAWLGADVVKLEPPRGDPGRGVTRDPSTVSQYFLNYNSNKRSVALDLKSPGGREVFLGLVPHYDVFVENYGPGAMESLGIEYETLSALNPGLIYGRIKGFGLSGPYSQYNCYDWVAQAAAGAFSVTGHADGPPLMPGPTVGDSGTGLQMALAITAAYVQKQRTGLGQFIEISMQEAVTLFMRTQGLAGWGTVPGGRTGAIRGAATTSVYPCAPGGPNDYVFIMVVTTTQWDALCAAMERPELAVDPRFADGASRVVNGEALAAELTAWTRQRDKHEAMRVLGSAGVPCSATLDTAELHSDQHLVARGFVQTAEHATAGTVRLLGNPLRMSGSQVPLRAAPLLGADTDSVLAADLGLSDERIAALREAAAIG